MRSYLFPFLLFSFLCLNLTLAQTPLTRIVFTKASKIPPKWTRHSRDAISPKTRIWFSGRVAPRPLRHFATRNKFFSYLVTDLQPGVYDLTAGLFDRLVCKPDKRVLRIRANAVVSHPVDLFRAAGGCKKAFHLRLAGIVVDGTGVLNVTVEGLKVAKPILNNLEIVGKKALITDRDASSSPVAMATANAQLSQSTSASPQMSLSANPSPSGAPPPFSASASSADPTPSVSSMPSVSMSVAPSSSASPATSAAPVSEKPSQSMSPPSPSPSPCPSPSTSMPAAPSSNPSPPTSAAPASEDPSQSMSPPPPSPCPSPSASVSSDPSVSAVPSQSALPASVDPSPSASPLAPSELPSASPSASLTVSSSGNAADSAKVAFYKYALPPGWEPYDVNGLDEGADFASSGSVTGPDGAYVGHMKKRGDYTYVHRLQEGVYDVRLGFMDFRTGCVTGKRVFSVAVNGKSTGSLDVFKAAGCETPYDVHLSAVTVAADEVLLFEFTSIDGYAPFLANFGATLHDPNASPSPAGSALVDIEINAGSNSDKNIPNSSKSYYSGTVTNPDGQAPNFFYKSSRYGLDFSYNFDLPPGTYDVTLGFAENYSPNHCSEPGKRVFNVYINELIQLEGYDIFAGLGCHVAEEIEFLEQSVSVVDPKPLTIRFEAIANFAQINYIRVKTAADRCIPVSSSGGLEGGADHAAHAVPGSYPPQINPDAPTSYVDSDGDGFVWVDIDGEGSHTHFFDSEKNIIGKITEYIWTLVETGEVISKSQKFRYKFPLGTTRLKLAVLDDSCTRDEAETTVTVTGKVQPGQYCYYYQGLEDPPLGGALLTETVHPSFASISSSVNLGFPTFSFDQTTFAVRCQFFLAIDNDSPEAEVSVETGGSGIAKLYKGTDLILDSASASTVNTILTQGLISFELVYRREDVTVPAQLKFLVDGVVPSNTHISHDRTTVVPILSALSPKEGKLSGGDKVKVTGFGLFQPLTVMFGDAVVSVLNDGATPTQFFVTAPASSSPDAVPVVVTTGAGASSNPVFFSYGGSCDPVKFASTSMLTAMGTEVDSLELPTCAVLGHDGKLYMGTLGGTIQVLAYHYEDLQVSSQCYSKALKDPKYVKNGKPASRDILGITIDPSDIGIRPYVSSSTLYWLEQKRLDNPIGEAWRNGAVDRFMPGSDPSDPGVCLVHDKRIVSNLPVSNHDHAVNALMFTQESDLLISVGGFTNLGLPGYKLGGFWETHLSAAVLKAKLSTSGFDGNIQYTNEDTPRLAKMIATGSVELYATGIRNGFGMTMTKSGDVYLADQGPNCSFGNTATSCSDYNETSASTWDPEAEVDWPGQVKHGWVACPYAVGRPDKVLHITKGKFYGHPNILRGGGECAWVDPNDDLTADDMAPPADYKPPMTLLKSSVTGIGEYGANHFCGKLRGELLLSTYKGGNTYRMGVQGSTVTSGPDVLANDGGISFVENAHGDLIFPQLNQKKVFVLRPERTMRVDLSVTGAVPWRHGAKGGTFLTVAGENFGAMPQVLVGGKNSNVVMSSGTEIRCVVPPGAGGALVDVVVKSSSGESATLEKAVLYSLK